MKTHEQDREQQWKDKTKFLRLEGKRIQIGWEIRAKVATAPNLHRRLKKRQQQLFPIGKKKNHGFKVLEREIIVLIIALRD